MKQSDWGKRYISSTLNPVLGVETILHYKSTEHHKNENYRNEWGQLLKELDLAGDSTPETGLREVLHSCPPIASLHWLLIFLLKGI